MLIQGTVECTTYKASSKVPGRIDDMKAVRATAWRRGSCSTRSTPELEAKLRQAEAVKSAAGAGPGMAGARMQQIEAALNMGEGSGRAGTGAQDLRPREEPLRSGVVPEQKLDEASANTRRWKPRRWPPRRSTTWHRTEPARRTRRPLRHVSARPRGRERGRIPSATRWFRHP